MDSNIPEEFVTTKILFIRRQKVMLDEDLARMNIKNWRCQIGTSNLAAHDLINPVISNNPEVVAICDNL